MSPTSHSSDAVDMKSFLGMTIRESYLLRDYISEGNFGAVYKSEQQFLGVPVRRVAVKLSKATQVDLKTAKDIFADAFLLAEAMDEMDDAQARTNLVHVFDVGLIKELDNRMFVVMEYIQGTDLERQFRAYQRVPANLLLTWVRQICTAVKGLHSLVPIVLHRDLKPNNILLGVDRVVRVVDFGLAAKLMVHGYVPGTAGTLAYMAPETMKGESVPASDVYSIGTILYEGLTGKHPFADLVPPINLPAGLYNDWLYEQKQTVRPEPPSHLNNTVTPDLDAVTLRCLEFKASRRYLNGGELLEALDPDKREDPPGLQALKEGQGLNAANDLEGARQALERGLEIRANALKTRFGLFRELANVLSKMENHLEAARNLVEAWKLTEFSAILPTRAERAELLKHISEAYRRVPNEFQANRYAELSKKELQ